MNFVAAALLLYLDEELAFWTLRSIIEDILPYGYYTDDLIGVKVIFLVLDMFYFFDTKYLPRVYCL
jgi:hypothetical protein